ncbi:Family of serine hydrolases 1 [Pleurostoma richardsiae]|uniref:Family of serine hydrolases 1 n=1 Tax=Pleurostoma richardsiae TaxID=41990 RepID=A0AA38RXC4_9PEZI|nr:Family of serine hydrolases 1 [Pleurostoma richardsiae]
MRILCLHGHGTSAEIFRSQTAAFRAKLDRSWQFDFVDAPFPCAPSPGIDVLFAKSGNYTWWPKNTVQAVRASHLWLDDYLADNGPYDGVCCFSQGCSLIGSYLLYHARETPDAPPPFSFAVFICGGLPFPVLEDLGLPISRRAHEINERTGKIMRAKAAVLYEKAAAPDQIQKGVGLWDNTTDLVHNPGDLPDPTDVFGLDFSAFPADVRIGIPTLNVYGAKDPRWPSSIQLAYFCDDRMMYDHGGGHDVPRSSEVSVKIAEMLKSLSQRK